MAFQDSGEFGARNVAHAQRCQMAGHVLAVIEDEAPFGKVAIEGDEGDLRGVAAAGKLALGVEDATRGNAVEPAGQISFRVPDLDRMRMACPVEESRTPSDPSPSMPVTVNNCPLMTRPR